MMDIPLARLHAFYLGFLINSAKKFNHLESWMIWIFV
jgi:hypothetical protein